MSDSMKGLTKIFFTGSLLLSASLLATPQYRWRRGMVPPSSVPEATVSPLQMEDHMGKILFSDHTQTLFWGQGWTSPSFAQDKIGGLDALFGGMPNSSYLSIAKQYFRGHAASSAYLGHIIDDSVAPPDSAFSMNGHLAVEEICRLTGQNPNPNTVYLVFTDQLADPANDYCAYHDVGQCANKKHLHYSYMPSLDGVSGCDPGDTSGLHSQGLSALADSAAHEFMETITDPNGDAWYDNTSLHDEIGDACSYTYTDANSLGLIQLSNGSQWRIQLEWSNHAFTRKTGQPSATPGDPHNGRRGCVAS